MKELGILVPVEINGVLDSNFTLIPPDVEPAMNETREPNRTGFGGTGFGRQQPRTASSNTIAAKAYRFTVQFCWTQITSEKRLEQRRLMEANSEQDGDQVAANLE